MRRSRETATVLVAAVCVLALAACGSSDHPSVRNSSSSSTPGRTASTSSSSPLPTGPLDTAPVKARDATCPLVSRAVAVEHGGMRLDRQVVLTQDGRVTGCDFYADQNWAASEHLPGPKQPAISVRISRYADATTAFNAMARVGQAGGQAHEVDLVSSQRGVAFRTRFDPADGAQDWAYVVAVGTTVVEVRTAQTASELNAVEIARATVAKL